MYSATFEMLLFACQQEKFYELYLKLLKAAWDCFEIQRPPHHDKRCDLKYSITETEAQFAVIDREIEKTLFYVEVKNLGMQQPLGHITVSSNNEIFIDNIVKNFQEKELATMFSPVLKVEKSEVPWPYN